MTGEPTVDTAINAIKYGVCDYLIKPFGKETLLKAVENAKRIKQLIDDKKSLEKRNAEYRDELENKVFSRTAALHSAMEGIITLLSYSVEAKDMYTAGHQKRVGNLAAAIAKKLGTGQNEIDLIRICGYIHDIGKIMVPAEILSKPGILSKLEMDLIREHPVTGFNMLKSANLPEVIGQTIYMHHERCDGSGYPQGLKADEIIHEAKILMVADVVEAMMSHRPYRPALGIDAAMDEIRKNSGRLYNHEIAEACLDLFERDGYQIEEETNINFPI
jgi:putative nucleotidyltransferase with HDIG domain